MEGFNWLEAVVQLEEAAVAAHLAAGAAVLSGVVAEAPSGAAGVEAL